MNQPKLHLNMTASDCPPLPSIFTCRKTYNWFLITLFVFHESGSGHIPSNLRTQTLLGSTQITWATYFGFKMVEWRGDRVMKPMSVWGWLGGHYGKRPMAEFGQGAGVKPLLFLTLLGFLMTTESQHLGLSWGLNRHNLYNFFTLMHGKCYNSKSQHSRFTFHQFLLSENQTHNLGISSTSLSCRKAS